MSSAPGRAVGAPSAGLSQFRGAESSSSSDHPGPLRSASPRPAADGVQKRCPASVPGSSQEEPLGSTRPAPVRRSPYRPAHPAPRSARRDNDGIIPVLARAVREVEAAVQRGRGRAVGPHEVPGRRPAGARGARPGQGRHDQSPRPQRAEQLKRLDGLATILAKTAARDTSLLALLAEDAVVSDAAATLKRDMLQRRRARGRARGGRARRSPATPPRHRAPGRAAVGRLAPARQPVPRPRLLRAPQPRKPRPRRLASWELLGPLFRSFEYGRRGAVLHAAARARRRCAAPGGLELMPHQAQVVAAAAAGHRTFLLADEPGLGKTAQALLAAQAANAYPLLVVVPNVVKTNWAREAGLWTPEPPGHRDPRRRRHHRRLRRHRHRQLRGARPARRLARRPRLPRHGRRRGALHQEQDLAALAARAAARPSGSGRAPRARC